MVRGRVYHVLLTGCVQATVGEVTMWCQYVPLFASRRCFIGTTLGRSKVSYGVSHEPDGSCQWQLTCSAEALLKIIISNALLETALC